MPDPTAKRGAGPGRFRDVHRFAELDSTNRWVLEQARAGAPEGLVAVADHQTAGRGRLGRTWIAPPRACLLVSVLLRPPIAPMRSHVITTMAGLAATDAVLEVAGFEPSLKWPNDLVAGHRKLAGMLSEAVVSAGALDGLVIGLGVNVNWAGFPSEIADTATACNIEAGRDVDLDALLDAWLRGLEARYHAFIETGDASQVITEYRTRCSTIGLSVRVEQADRVLVGKAVDVDDDGRLVLATESDSEVAISVGDVVHVRRA